MMPTIYLTRIDPAKHMDRWYSVTVQSTLLDRWAVVCAWGSRRSNYVQQRAIPVENMAQAQQVADKIVARKIHKGYVEGGAP